VAVLAGVFAKWLHYSEADLRDVILAGLLHDVGKIGIPAAILNKPGALTLIERECMQQHTLKGYDIIKAWNEFFYDEIPKAGYKVNEEYNLYFEFYPQSVNGEFELWVPVVKADL
jgi:HD-GYP domain-containing protein (c-di-GMP phosphodiesterase class II)